MSRASCSAESDKFTRQFDEILEAEGGEVVAVGPRAPNMNAYAERFVQSVKEECLGHFIFFGQAHLRHVLDQYVDYYNRLRPHQGVGNVPLDKREATELTRVLRSRDVVCEERLGGLLKHYRVAA
jgi:putative transposase